MNKQETLDILHLRHVGGREFAASFAGVDYKATGDTTSLGALIFALKPQLVLPDGRPCTSTFQLMATVALAQLRGHTKGKTIPEHIVDRWRWGAIDLAPCAATAADVMWTFDEALKPKAFMLRYS